MTGLTKKIFIILGVIGMAFIIFLVVSKPATSNKTSSDLNVSLKNGIQIVSMTESARGYLPNSFTINKGVPVRWEIESTSDRTCASVVLLPDYKIRAFLKPGKNVVEFTPEKTGPIKFSCSMGMYTGTFNVIE